MNERDDDLMRRFLTEDLTGEERAAVEERFMQDTAFFESLTSLEHEMMVDLIDGRLPERWRAPFEAAIAGAHDRRRRLDDVRALMAAMPASADGPKAEALRSGRLGWMAMAASLVILAGGAALWKQRASVPAPVTGEHVPDAPLPPTVMTALLEPGPDRSASDTLNRVNVAADVSRLRLVCVLEPTGPGTVVARMRAVGGAGLELPPATQTRVTSEGLEVVWELPASAVEAGDYLITYRLDDAGGARVLGTRFVRITK